MTASWFSCQLRLSMRLGFIACGSSQAPPISGSRAEGSVPEAAAFSQSYMGLVSSIYGQCGLATSVGLGIVYRGIGVSITEIGRPRAQTTRQRSST